jgi:hypothetical protein
MARKNDDGRFTLSAGEIGAYTVCPEAWRLKTIAKAKSICAHSVIEGQQLHKEWVTKFEEAAYLKHRIRFVIALLIVAAILYLLLLKGGIS